MSDVFHATVLGQETEEPSPCHPWHAQGSSDQNFMAMVGHRSDRGFDFIESLISKLPEISCPSSIRVGSTGYWNQNGQIEGPEYARCLDEVGRHIFLIGNMILCQRYNGCSTLIQYTRDTWSMNPSGLSTEKMNSLLQEVENSRS